MLTDGRDRDQQVSCGDAHTLAIVYTGHKHVGEVYSWGCSSSGRTGECLCKYLIKVANPLIVRNSVESFKKGHHPSTTLGINGAINVKNLRVCWGGMGRAYVLS